MRMTRGRPSANDHKVFEGILWILRSGARWQDLPEEFPSPVTCWRRLWDWRTTGLAHRLLHYRLTEGLAIASKDLCVSVLSYFDPFDVCSG